MMIIMIMKIVDGDDYHHYDNDDDHERDPRHLIGKMRKYLDSI